MSQDSIEIHPSLPLDASIRPPGSKSITNRALVCAALAEGESILSGALDSEDTRVMLDALAKLGLEFQTSEDKTEIRIRGCGGRLAHPQVDLFVANSGTTIRFLTAMVAAGRGQYRLDGIARMRQRPIGDLLHALQQLGADARSENDDNCPPVVVRSNGLRGGEVEIAGNISSQYLSGLMMAAPYAQESVNIRVLGELVSQPYVDMTLEVMRSFAGEIEFTRDQGYLISAPRPYRGQAYPIEPDASAASYFWGAAAICGGSATVQGLTRNALQGDVAFCECLAAMGCQVDYLSDSIRVTGGELRGIDVDMNGISDTVQTLAAVALFASGPTRITNVAHIRHKETDRIGDLAREIRKFGANVEEFEDGLTINPPAALNSATIDTYNDHRMAMSLSLVGLKLPGVVINDPGCTVKTYPNFFDDLTAISVR